MIKLALLPFVAGAVCLITAGFLILRIGGPLDVQILDHYFVLSPKWLLVAGMALVLPSGGFLAAH